MMRNRIVAVSYLNTIPFIYGIEHAGIDLYADLLLSPPRGCASLLRDGGAEIALIPVAAVPSIPDIRIVTPFCIGASRSVRTVVLAADSPLDRLDTIYLDSHSLTSVRLVRILASKLWGIRPEWKELKDFSARPDRRTARRGARLRRPAHSRSDRLLRLRRQKLCLRLPDAEYRFCF